jgi:hypothetical protein
LTILCAYFAANCAPAKFRAIHDRSGANQGGDDVEGDGGDGDGSEGGEGRVGEEGSLPDKSTTIEKSFLVSAQAAASQTFGLTAGSVKEEIPLKSSGTNISRSQISRPQVQKEFIQGQNASSYTDEFSQLKGAGVIDILIVMDNSGSMSQEQANMATKMAPRLSSIGNASWKIGVVTTDRSDPCMRAVISKGDANAITAFQNAMSAGSDGDGEEHGLQMAVKGLNCTGTNWLRANSGSASRAAIVAAMWFCATTLIQLFPPS